jgi:tagatose-1,6-bisphosphate aldolase non-catalytic subunit AgaZ/GatZ
MGALAIAGNSGNSGIVQQAGAVAPEWFEVEVVTTAANQTYSWQISEGSDASSTTDWGDGNTIAQAGTGIRTYTYAAAGTYVVRIQASFGASGAMNMRPNTDRTRLGRVLGPIPGFAGLTNLTNFFQNCSGLTGSIPADLLRYVVNVTNLTNFFQNCSGLTGSIPADLLRYVVNVTTLTNFFQNCSGLTGSIPADLLRYVVNVTTLSRFFQNCSGLTGSIPADLLRYVVNVTNLTDFFQNCSGLTGSIPADLLRYVVNVTTLSRFFQNCTRLQLQPDLFGPSPETFFSTRTPSFTSAFRNLGTEAGTAQGTAPALWTYTYGGTPTTASCFANNSATNLTNWAQIPIAWGGPA